MVLVFLPLSAVQRYQTKISNHSGSLYHKEEAPPLISSTWYLHPLLLPAVCALATLEELFPCWLSGAFQTCKTVAPVFPQSMEALATTSLNVGRTHRNWPATHSFGISVIDSCLFYPACTARGKASNTLEKMSENAGGCSGFAPAAITIFFLIYLTLR